MILGFRHKGLRPCYEKGDSSKLQPHHTGRIRLVLTRLDAATGPEMMDEPGYRLPAARAVGRVGRPLVGAGGQEPPDHLPV